MNLRGWNPWYLRRMIAVFMRDIDRHDTETEQCWRFLSAVLDGQEHPADYALRYSVEGDTLVVPIDGQIAACEAEEDRPDDVWVPRK